jgi:ferredoxin-NADP reductase
LRKLSRENLAKGNKFFFQSKLRGISFCGMNFHQYQVTTQSILFPVKHQKSITMDIINEEFLPDNVDDFKKHFYVCEPPEMIDSLTRLLTGPGATTDSVVFEK